MATILITGGAGFLGSHVADACIAKGDRVIIVDHHKRTKRRYVHVDAEVYPLDFTDARVRDVLMKEKPDAVVHLAAQISVTASLARPLEDAEHNIVRSLRLLEWCKDAGVKKFVFASSGAAIYGDQSQLPTPVLEDTLPLSPYGIGKQAFERYLEHVHSMHGLSYVSLRFSNLYGPRQQISQPSGEGNVISFFLHRLLVSGEPIKMFGDGSASRDFLYVGDAVALVQTALDVVDFSGTVHGSTGREVSIRELWETVLAIHGQGHVVFTEPYRQGEVFRSALDAAVTKEMLGWEPRVSLEEGLREMYAWYKKEFGN